MTASATPADRPDVRRDVRHETGQGVRPDDAVLAEVIADLRRTMRRAARASEAGMPFSVAQLELMSCLAEHPGARPGELARLLRLAPNSVTTLVNGLRAQEMITRTGREEDRRAVSLSLSAAGAHAVAGWQATNAAILGDALAGLHPGWRHLLLAATPALRELIKTIDELTPKLTPKRGPAGKDAH